jgi:hypothetical protein
VTTQRGGGVSDSSILSFFVVVFWSFYSHTTLDGTPTMIALPFSTTTAATTATYDTVAIVVDTSHALQRLHGTSVVPTVLVVTGTTVIDPRRNTGTNPTTSSSSSSWNVGGVVPPWMDVCVTLSSSTLSSSSSSSLRHRHHPTRPPIGRFGRKELLEWKASFRTIRQPQTPPKTPFPSEEEKEEDRSLPGPLLPSPSSSSSSSPPLSPMVIDYHFVVERQSYHDAFVGAEGDGGERGGEGEEERDGPPPRWIIEWSVAGPSPLGRPPPRCCTSSSGMVETGHRSG